MKDDRFYFIHMLECISNIGEDTAGVKENFTDNRTIRDAVMHNLQLLAESLADFRNVVVHDYLKIDFDQIWLIIRNHLPPLKADLTRIVGEPRPRS